MTVTYWLDVQAFLAAIPGMGTADTDILIGRPEAYAKATGKPPQVAIYIIPTGGRKPDDFIGQDGTSTSTGIRHLNFQIEVRGASGKFAAVAVKTQQVRDGLHLKKITGYMLCSLESEPFMFPPDDTGAYRWAINFVLDKVT